MKIFVKAKPNSNEEKVERLEDGSWVVSVKEPPVEGLANRAIALAIARHLGVAPSHVRLLSGFSSRQKVFEVK